LSYFHPEDGQLVRAVPGSGLDIPIWILGSSLFGAQVAALMGLPFAFASHFAAAQLIPAVAIYRERFRPSGVIDKPQVMLGVNVVAADTDEEARLLATSGRQAFASLRRGMPTTLPPPNKEFEKEVVPFKGIRLEEVQSVSMVGSPETVHADLEDFIERTQADELIVVSHIYDHAARLRSYELIAPSL
jgi:luciferase family oxidoreductase group 1